MLEDFILSKQRIKRAQRPFRREVAEMIRYAVGYQSRSFVSFGQPIEISDYDPNARRDMVRLQRRVRTAIGQLYKVLPTALIAASIRPGMNRADLEERIDQLIEILRSEKANLDVKTGSKARYRVRERAVLRYYARTIDHLLKRRDASLNTH